MSAKKRVRGRYATAVTEARDLLRWRSPLRTELWAGRLTAAWIPEGADDAQPFLEQLAADRSPEARLALAALAVVGAPAEVASTAAALSREPATSLPTTPQAGGAFEETPHKHTERIPHHPTATEETPLKSPDEWVKRMGRVECDGGWYGRADPHGEQVLAVLSFRYDNGQEPHLVVVGIDQVNGGYAVDAAVEEPRFLGDLDLAPAGPALVAGRILDAFELTDSVLGAPATENLQAERAFVLARTAKVPDPARHAPDDTAARFDGLPEGVPGASEAFERLVEFVGDRPLWWSPARASAFLTQWLPREAIMSEAAIEATPDVVRAWTTYLGDLPDVQQAIDEVAPWLPALMANESLAGLRKRIATEGPRGDGYAAQ